MTSRGRLIALEGLDGSGKTTQARVLADRIGALYTAEPGATALGATLRSVLLDPGTPKMSTRAEALIVAADRAQHVEEVVTPALESGRWVVTDRFSGSTFAYQGFGRGLDLDGLRALDRWATGGLTPDLTVLVDLPVEAAVERRAPRGADRLEGLGVAFQERVRRGYLALASSDRDWAVVDGGSSVDEVARRIFDVVNDQLAPLPMVAP